MTVILLYIYNIMTVIDLCSIGWIELGKTKNL